MAVWIVYVSLGLLFALNASACETGWSRHGNRCFKAFNGPKSWKDAEVRCLNSGGNLASVHSFKEQAFLKLLVSSSKAFWIGGYDAVSEGTWFWSDGSKMNFHAWNSGEPNNKYDEHCMETNYGAEGNWNDRKCTVELPFVCAVAI
ncbi:galactose-specific lectin nattectin-like [Carassius auratus]|uniref:Galactose-specific lectin nattectin-like n=1 Tax=Carassius auratus TaxID=7957 RepID=A0A6P6QUZ8_CARAU|nr:galactose-specific lectin nattectin-like [Carassius auratus]XP_052392057.1 galactose-specific lectin nattectin-like [Carassius gibelio]XP_052398313.1 galactose-specific lectin nattectin-like [Carassius gibelio]XP_052429555.1 galactose-specific lectin nattectin-like [Carassius gibelio]XP_052446959.1 galactose-specific lectin nattectin-like [Carassius gibelio]XP_052446969.1 galactose-specific lectin nattectin-like [Carassius gibelio]XP_052446978.1 galactose-specific lectin nattectin-like [Ca